MLAERLRRRARSLEAIQETELADECRLLASILDEHRVPADMRSTLEAVAWLNARGQEWEARGVVELAGACQLVADILVSRAER